MMSLTNSRRLVSSSILSSSTCYLASIATTTMSMSMAAAKSRQVHFDRRLHHSFSIHRYRFINDEFNSHSNQHRKYHTNHISTCNSNSNSNSFRRLFCMSSESSLISQISPFNRLSSSTFTFTRQCSSNNRSNTKIQTNLNQSFANTQLRFASFLTQRFMNWTYRYRCRAFSTSSKSSTQRNEPSSAVHSNSISFNQPTKSSDSDRSTAQSTSIQQSNDESDSKSNSNHNVDLSNSSSKSDSAKPVSQGSSSPSSSSSLSSSTNKLNSSSSNVSARPRRSNESKSTFRQKYKRLRERPLFMLCKIDLSIFAAMSTIFGYSIAGGPFPLTPSFYVIGHYSLIVIANSFCAIAATISNQIAEVKFDAIMPRTRPRPLVTGMISIQQAHLLSYASGTAGVMMLYYIAQDWLAPSLALICILSYRFIYTPMKRRTIWNTEIGAVVGAIPILIGASIKMKSTSFYTVTNQSLSFIHEPLNYLSQLSFHLPTHFGSVMLPFAYMISWQFPHFMQIGNQFGDQYKSAGFKMRGEYDKLATSSFPNQTRPFASAPTHGMRWITVISALPFIGHFLHLTSPMFIITGGLCNIGLYRIYRKLYDENRGFENGDANATVSEKKGFDRGGIYLHFIVFLAFMFLHSYSTFDEQNKVIFDPIRNTFGPAWNAYIEPIYRPIIDVIARYTCPPLLHMRLEAQQKYNHACAYIFGKQTIQAAKETVKDKVSVKEASAESLQQDKQSNKD